jgi:AcrR family transcriptional regulator
MGLRRTCAVMPRGRRLFGVYQASGLHFGDIVDWTYSLVELLGIPVPRASAPDRASLRRRCIIATTPPSEEPRPRGRHRSLQAAAAILKATLYLLERQPLRKVTADAIARRAGVSKTTIYKWWPNKRLVALDAYLAGMTEQVAMPDTGSAEMDFTLQLKSVMAFYTSPLGRLFSQFLAEGQSDPGFLALFRERFLYARRDMARIMWRRGVDRGEIREEIDGEIALDLIYGPMIFRLLAGHGSLSDRESEAVVAAVFGGLRRTKNGRRPRARQDATVSGAALQLGMNPARS